MNINKKKFLNMVLGIFLFLILVLVLVFFVGAGGINEYKLNIFRDAQTSKLDKFFAEQKKYENPQGFNKSPHMGVTSSPIVTIVEYSDFLCTHCRDSYSKIRKIGFKYPEYVKIIYKDFPTHEESVDFILAGKCAGRQGLFWSIHDKFFQLQENIDTSQIPQIAAQIGLDKKKFTQCVNKKLPMPDIKQDIRDAQRLGVEATPTWFINGYKIAGDMPEETWERLINYFIRKNYDSN